MTDRSPNERTRASDTVSSIAAEIVEDIAAMKDEIGTLLDDGAEHEIKHALLNRVTALQGAINLIATLIESCDYENQCPLKPVIDHFVTPPKE